MVSHMVYFDILVTIQMQFINVQYRDTSKVENMVRIGVYIKNIAKTAIASLYLQCYNPISYSGHPRGSKHIGWLRCGGGVHEGHIWPAAYVLHGCGSTTHKHDECNNLALQDSLANNNF